MNTSNPIFSIKNFRSFGSDGADFELAPITVLTGCNSAGKSSLVKALMLLSNQSKSPLVSSSDYDIQRHIPSQDLYINARELKLGQFDNVLNDKSENKIISFSYRVWSDCLQEEVIVTRHFVSKKDTVNNATLRDLIIEKTDGTQIYWVNGGIEHSERVNFSAIESNYIHNSSIVDLFLKKNNDGWTELYSKILTKEQKEERKKNNYISLLVNEVVCLWFTQHIDYIISSSALVHRAYSIEDDNKMSRILRKWNERDNDYNNEYFADPYLVWNKPGAFLKKWIKGFQIGDSIEFKGTPEGLGMLVYIVKEGGTRRLLADEGYGITQLVSLLLQINNNIQMCIQPDMKSGNHIYPPKLICVEEPEVHLHPKYQSLLAEMFVEAYQKYNIRFIIETHSEYLIRKLQVMVADKGNTLCPKDVSLNYVEKDENGVSTNRKIEIQEDGRLSEPFGPGFYDEADTLALDLFRKKTILS